MRLNEGKKERDRKWDVTFRLQIEGFFLRKPYRRLFIRFRKIKFINWFFHICILRSNDVKK